MPLTALRRLSVYTAFLSICSIGLVACGGSDSPEPPPQASSSTGGGASSSSDEPSSSSSSSSSVSSSAKSSATSSSDASSSSSEPAPDRTPDAFNFDAQSNVSLGATVTSNTVTIQGIDAEPPISIRGGQYAVNGGAFTAGAGNVKNGDEVTVQVTASEHFAAESIVTLTVGDVDGVFTVTTEDEDTVPDSFGFAPLDNLALGEEVTSGSVTLTGFNTPVSISVTGGEYSLDGGDTYTGEPGQVSAGSTVALKAIAPEGPGETREVQLMVGADYAVWALTTAPDEEAPEGDIAFPPQMSATGADSLTIRGRASDELSDVAEVTLTVENDGVEIYTLQADEETGFAEWQQAVTLASGTNLVSLQVKDEAGNELAEPVEVTVVKQPYAEPFPDDSGRFFEINDVVLDEAHNRILLIGYDEDPETLGRRVVMAVDLASGQRSEFATSDGDNESLIIGDVPAGVLNPANNRLIATDGEKSSTSAIYGFDLETGQGNILMESDSGDESVTFSQPRDIVASPSNPENFYLAADGPNRILRLTLSTGDRQVVTDPDAGIGEGPGFSGMRNILVTQDEQTMYVGQGLDLFKVDMESGDRSEIPLDYYDGLTAFNGMMLAGPKSELYLFDHLNGLIKKDGDTGEWVSVYPYDETDAFDARLADGTHYVKEDDFFFIAQDAHKALFAYDLVTNEYVIITRYSE